MLAKLGQVLKFLCFDEETPVAVPALEPNNPATAETSVTTASTTKPIKDIRVGDAVFARNPRTGETSIKQVTSVSKNTAYELVRVELAEAETGNVVATLQGTAEHPFFTTEGMVAMGQLGIGTKIIARAGPPLVVHAVSRQPHPDGIPVYNFAEFEFGNRQQDWQVTSSHVSSRHLRHE